MAVSTCGKCGNHRFELTLVEPSGSRYQLYFVQCSSCGVPVGVQEYNNITAMLEKQNAAIKQLAAKLHVHVNL